MSQKIMESYLLIVVFVNQLFGTYGYAIGIAITYLYLII